MVAQGYRRLRSAGTCGQGRHHRRWPHGRKAASGDGRACRRHRGSDRLVSTPTAIDPLETAYLLAAETSGADRTPADITRLIRGLDALAYAVHFVEADGGSSELEPPRLDYAQTYDAIRQRFPFLGKYWLALHPVLQEGI